MLNVMQSHPPRRTHFGQYQAWIYAPCKSPTLHISWAFLTLMEESLDKNVTLTYSYQCYLMWSCFVSLIFSPSVTDTMTIHLKTSNLTWRDGEVGYSYQLLL